MKIYKQLVAIGSTPERPEGVLHLVLMSLVLLTMFISWKVNNIAIVCLFLYSAYCYYRNPARPEKSDFILFLPAFLFIAYLAGAAWAADKGEAWSQLEKRLPMLAFPLIFFFLKNRITKDDAIILLRVFLLVCLLISLTCYGAAIWNMIANRSFKVVGLLEREYYYFSYLYFTKIVDIDPIYLSFYVNFCIAFLLTIKGKKPYEIILLLNFIVFDILVASKIGIACLVGIFLIHIYFRLKNKLWALLISVTLVSGILFFINTSEFLKDRFWLSLEFDYDAGYAGAWNSLTQRLAIWSCGAEAIDRSFPWGYGTSNGQIALNALYREKGYIRGFEDEYNVHSEYMYTLLDVGLAGFILLLLMLILPFIQAVRRRQPLLFYFQLLTALYFLIEVVFARRHGLIFHTFYFSLLVLMTSSPSIRKSTVSNEV